MADQIIGRVFVKVSPDTSDFREEARAKLEREESRLPELTTQLHIEMAEGETAEVVAEAKATRQAAQDALKPLTLKVNLDDLSSVEQALAQVNSQLSQLDAIEIPVDLDRDSLTAMKELLEQQVRDIGIDLKVNLDDPDSIKRALAQIEAEVSKLGEVELNVAVNEGDLKAAKELLEARLGEVEVPVKPDLSNADAAKVSASLSLLTRLREVVIRPVLDRSGLAAIAFVDVLSGFRALRENIEQAHEAFLGLFTSLPQVATMATGVVALSGALLSAAGNAISLVGGLAQLLPIALALPGIAIGFGLTAAALKDFSDVLPAIAERFSALQTVISDGFWAIAKGPINNLLTAALPLLEQGLATVSGSVGKFFAALAGEAASASGGFLSQLPDMFARLNESIGIFTSHAPALVQIMTIFGQIGSSILPPLAALIGQTADEFAAFLSGQVAGDGLSTIVNNAISALSGLIETIKGAFQVFGALFSATQAAGLNTFAALGAGLQAFAKTLNAPEVQATITGLFKSANEGVSNFLTQAGPALGKVFTSLANVLTATLPMIGSTLGTVASAIGEVFANPAFQSGLSAFLQGVSQGIQALVPALAPVGDLIGSLGPVLGQLAGTIGQVLGALAPTFSGLLSNLSPIITMLGGALMQVLQAVSPVLSQIASVVSSTLTGLLPLLQPIIDALVMIVQAVLPALMPLISALQPLLLSLAQLVLPVVATLLQALAPILATLVGAVTPVINVITELINLLVPVLVPALNLVAQLLGENLGHVATAVAGIIAGLVKVIQGVIDFIAGVFTGDWDRAWKGIKEILSGVIDAIMAIVKGVLGVAGTMFSHMKAGLERGKEFWSNVWSAIKDFAASIWNGIVSYIRGQLDAMIAAFKGVQGLISGAISALWSWVKSTFTNGINAASSAVVSGVDKVVGFFQNLPGQIKSALGNLGSLLINAGKQIIQGLLNGIESMIGAVKDKLSDLTSLIPDWKGPEAVDRMLLHEAGQLVIEGFIKGLESRYDAVRKSLADLTRDVEGTDFRPPTANLGVNAGLYTGEGADPSGGKTINYYAAPGSSMGAEEDLFGALGRARAWGW